jgi:hypothetical protein
MTTPPSGAIRSSVVAPKNAGGSRNEDAAWLAVTFWTVTATAGVFVLILSDDFPLIEIDRLKRQAERLSAEYPSVAGVYTDTYSHFLDLPSEVFVSHVFPSR